MCEGGVANLCLAAVDHHWLGVALEVFIFFYAFCGLAIVCDDFLVMSLETLCVRWNVREDIAGASFMAFGSAAPEIVVNAVVTLQSVHADPAKSKTDLGIGAIIGSGLIAFSLIPACCALLAGGDLVLKRRPLLRDMTAYAMALAFLCYAFSDGTIQTYEAAVMLGMYVMYLMILSMSPGLREWYLSKYVHGGRKLEKRKSFVIRNQEQQRALVDSVSGPDADYSTLDDERGGDAEGGGAGGHSKSAKWREKQAEVDSTFDEHHPVGMGDRAKEGALASYAHLTHHHHHSEGASNGERRTGVKFSESAAAPPPEELASPTSEGSEEEDYGAFGKVMGVVVAPLRFVFTYTCPPCEHDSERAAWYPVTFATSFVWVALFSYAISTIVERWVDLSGLPLILFGIILVAVGAEIPDTVQSVTVARRGYGSMAVSNAVGSQIINILVGLGLPWFVTTIAGGDVKVRHHSDLQVAAFFQAGNVLATFCLLLLLAFATGANKAILNKAKGTVMLCTYLGLVGTFAAIMYNKKDLVN